MVTYHTPVLELHAGSTLPEVTSQSLMQQKSNKLSFKKRPTKFSIRSSTPPTPLLELSSSDSSEDEVCDNDGNEEDVF